MNFEWGSPYTAMYFWAEWPNRRANDQATHFKLAICLGRKENRSKTEELQYCMHRNQSKKHISMHMAHQYDSINNEAEPGK